MKKSYLFTVLTALALIIGLQPKAKAQINVQAHLGLNVDASDFLLGGGVRIPINSIQLGGIPIEANPTIEFYPGYGGEIGSDLAGIDASLFVVNLDALYPLDLAESIDLYAGAGLGVYRFGLEVAGVSDSNTEIILNLIGGAVFAAQGSFSPFAQITLGLGEGSGVILKGGVLVGIGGGG